MSGFTDIPFTKFIECMWRESDIEPAGGDGRSAAAHFSHVPPLVLAYVGDAIHEVYIRGRLARDAFGSVHKLHVEATGYVRCDSQAEVIRSISEALTEDERDIVRRGRNAHSGYVPKNANVADYRHATGFEALLGYLYFNQNFDRLNHLLNLSYQRAAERNGKAVIE